MINTIKNLFHIWQGHQITDEEIYNQVNHKQYPIITGQNEIKGYTDNPYITDIPCITIPSKGIVEKLYLQTKPFDANNTIALIPKDRTEIDLEYIIFTQSEYITGFISSTNINNYLNKGILEGIEISYPNYEQQIKIRNAFKNLYTAKSTIAYDIQKIDEQLSRNISYSGEEVTIDQIFYPLVGSDDSMTEYYAYLNQGEVPIYSGASTNNGVFRSTNRVDYNFDEYITWSISGKAGTMYIRTGACCLTRDCGILVPKDKNKINLQWFILTQEANLKNFAIGRGGLGRLKKNLIKLYNFILPTRDIQDKISTEYLKLKHIKTNLNTIDKKFGQVL